MDKRWARPRLRRHQITLLSPTLDEVIHLDDPIRTYEAILRQVDWRPWEKAYDGYHGQPPIHPRLVAGCFLFGLSLGLTSTRQLEDATRKRLDFIWFLEGMTIDHSTFAGFRTRFCDQLRSLLRDLNRLAREHSKKKSCEVTLSTDGTRLRANSDRTGARTATWLVAKLAELQRQYDELVAAMAEADEREQCDGRAAGEDEEPADKLSAAELQKRIGELELQKEKLQNALEEARRRTEAKRAHDGQSSPEARVPLTDPDAHVLPNKEGGHGPNYTPVASMDVDTRMVVSGEVPEAADEASTVANSVEATEETFGKKPDAVLFDGNFASGQNLKDLEEQGIDAYSPVGMPVEGNPAARPDATEPVAREQWDKLPMKGKRNNRKLDRAAFVYDQQSDCYLCPMGRRLDRERVVKRSTRQGVFEAVQYQCIDCTDCPLSPKCLSRNAKRRRVSRDCFETYREQTGKRMSTEEGRQIYKARAPTSEGFFGWVKGAKRIRQFRTRGQNKVNSEWLWICAGYSMARLVAILAENAETAPNGTAQDAQIVSQWTLFPHFHAFARSFRSSTFPARWAA